jgi:hypothetical protein
LGAAPRGGKKKRRGITAEVMAEDVKSAQGIPESAGHFFWGASIEEISSQGLVLTLPGQGGFEKKQADLT